MESCREKVDGQPCVGLAVADGLCSVHLVGYRQQRDGDAERRCLRCRRNFATGEWYRQSGEEVQHARPCREHAETTRERKKAEST